MASLKIFSGRSRRRSQVEALGFFHNSPPVPYPLRRGSKVTQSSPGTWTRSKKKMTTEASKTKWSNRRWKIPATLEEKRREMALKTHQAAEKRVDTKGKKKIKETATMEEKKRTEREHAKKAMVKAKEKADELRMKAVEMPRKVEEMYKEQKKAEELEGEEEIPWARKVE